MTISAICPPEGATVQSLPLRLLGWAAWLSFIGYLAVCVIAGGWGVVGARWDQRHLLGYDPTTLTPLASACVISQYRFLRALELGFGLYSWRFRQEIFSKRPYNALFLSIMSLGVAARLLSLAVDGRPSGWFYAFLISELVGVVLIAAYTVPRLDLPRAEAT